MTLDNYQTDDSEMPLRLGNAVRVPSHAYNSWGIPEGMFVSESDAQYPIEWKGGGTKQMDHVIESLEKAGMENYSQYLRNANAKVVAAAVKRFEGKVNILEPGFGESTVNMFDALHGNDKDRIYITGIEPSVERGEKAAAKLEERGLKRYKDFEVHADIDNHILHYVNPGSQHIICSVASIHHHAYLDRPFQVIHTAMSPEGIFTISDWHNSMWEHPNRVYEFLKTMNWETKREDLEAFQEKFPKATEPAPVLDPLDENSNKEIRKFWRDGWVPVRKEAIERDEFNPEDDILMLEGHRLVERYQEQLEECGFKTETPLINELYKEIGFTTNPQQHNDDNRILMTITGQKDSFQ